jgi:aspartyl-tRNA(Asn)/glutamyl-tRNA(Gln) amidotransferase subunit A
MTNLAHLSLTESLKGLESRQFSAVELTQAHLQNIARVNGEMNAYTVVTDEQALQMAEASDARRASGKAGKLEGIPIGVKDLFCTKGVLSTAGSHILDGFKPEYESTVTRQLWNAGAVMLGKTNMDEFAMGSANITSHYGPVKNPWTKDGSDKTLVPGGSSGGSAAAVAAYLAPMALGTDTGGSIRQPAAFCGIVGIKPTYGRCSRWGIIAFASSLDQAGPMTRTVEDAALTLEVMSGHDAMDSTSAPLEVPNYLKNLNPDLRGKKIGIPKEYRVDGMSAEIEQLWQRGIDWAKDAGAEIVEVSLPHTQYALATYYIIAPAEASSNLARYDGVRYGLRVMPEKGNLDDMYSQTRAKGFGAEVKRRILIGTYVLSAGYYDAYYKQAQRVRSLIARDFREAFTKVDALLTPTAPSAAFAIGEKQEDPIAMYLNDVFTVPTSLAGLPAMSVPGGLSSEGLPLGLQIIGKTFDEQTVLNVGYALEKASGFKLPTW